METKDIAVGCIREMGDITLAEGEPQSTREYRLPLALVLTFQNEHALRKAIHEGIVKFGPFGAAP